jgi:hypothetical protein
MRRQANSWYVTKILFGFLLSALLLILALIYTYKPTAVNSAPLSGAQSRLRGVVHVHSSLSHDSNGKLSDILKAARKKDLDFVILTEHDKLPQLPAYSSDGASEVLLIAGTEISTYWGHLLAFGIDRLPPMEVWKNGDPIRNLKEYGIPFLAPAHIDHPSSPWTGRLTGEEVQGLEILNPDSMFHQSFRPPYLRFGLSAVSYPLNPPFAFLKYYERPSAVLRQWDEMNQVQPVAAICGSDAHGSPSYESQFGIVSQYVPNPSIMIPQSREDAILHEIFSGQSYCVIDAFGEAPAFSFHAQGPTQQADFSGEVDVPAKISVAGVPTSEVRVHLLRDGVELSPDEATAKRSWNGLSAGIYRVEVDRLVSGLFGRKYWLPWVFSNPIRVKTSQPKADKS